MKVGMLLLNHPLLRILVTLLFPFRRNQGNRRRLHSGYIGQWPIENQVTCIARAIFG